MPKKQNKLKIHIVRSLELLIKNYSTYSFPLERGFILLGSVSENAIHISAVWHPDDWWQYCHPDHVIFPPHWFTAANKYAREHDLTVVGTAHSHTYEDDDVEQPFNYSTPSEDDFRNFSTFPLLGICTVVRGSNGKMKSKFKLYTMLFGAELLQ